MTTPRPITALPWRGGERAVLLGPHPDDFDAVGVTLRWLHDRGHVLGVLVVSASASGVLDAYLDTADPLAKAAAREAEQLAATRFFGLPDAAVEFLRVPEDEDGALVDSPATEALLAARLATWRPDLVLLPHGADTNAGHQRTFAMFARLAPRLSPVPTAWLIRDPKTVDFRTDLYCPFDEEAATWKRRLLLHHRSQEHRNRLWRGHGFDDRILAVNRALAQELGCAQPYAEAFEVWRAG